MLITKRDLLMSALGIIGDKLGAMHASARALRSLVRLIDDGEDIGDITEALNGVCRFYNISMEEIMLNAQRKPIDLKGDNND